MKQKGFSVAIIVIVLAVAAIAIAYYFLSSKSSSITTAPSPSATSSVEPTKSPSPTSEAVENGWLKYSNPKYNFEINYPSKYKIADDKSGWPDAVLILYDGGQSYNLVIEVWKTKSEYETKYSGRLNSLTVKEQDGSFITLLNNNDEPEVDEIISTFKFTK